MEFGYPGFGVRNFRVWSSGAQSLGFPISEFCNMVIHEGNEHRESSNKVRDWISSIPHLGVAGDRVRISGVWSLPSQSLTKWDMKEASQGEPRNRGPEFRSPAFGVFLPQISQHDT